MQKVVDGSSSLKDAIAIYSDEVFKRSAEEFRVPRENALALMNWDRLMDAPMVKKGLMRTDIPAPAAEISSN
jgi:hypothetical protein